MECLLSPQWLHLGLLRQNLWVCPNRKHLLHWRGERTLGETSKSTLKIDREFGILVDRNLISTIRVGMRLPSLWTAIRLNPIMGTTHFAPSKNSSSEREVSNLMTPNEKIRVEGDGGEAWIRCTISSQGRFDFVWSRLYTMTAEATGYSTMSVKRIVYEGKKNMDLTGNSTLATFITPDKKRNNVNKIKALVIHHRNVYG
ncbi:hypothetical protein QTP88_019332 [Uroleucon formosanum]